MILLFIPLIANGNLYYVGGDDMRLYYIFPDGYLKNYVSNLIAGNTLAGANTGYATVAYYAPMFYFIKFLKLVPINTQFLMYGLNLALGFLFFYNFLGLYIKKSDWMIRVASSIFYILSPFLIITMYRNQMLSMYLVSIIPATLYYFLKGIRQNKYLYTLLSVIIFSVFSTTINTLPWWSAFLITFSLVLFYEFLKNKLGFIKQSLLWVITFLLLNIYWILHFVNSQIDGSGLKSAASYYSSVDFLADNLRVMRGVSTLFSPLNIIFNSPQIIFKETVGFLTYVNIIFFALIALGLYYLKKSELKKKNLYILFFLSFLISWYMFSPNLGEWGPKAFLLMGRKIPFFTMYRNMFDKFSLSLAFFFAGSLAISLTLISQNISMKLIKIICILLVLISLINSRDFLQFKYTSEQQLYRSSGQFNKDYMDLISYFNNLDNKSKVLWLPLNFPTYGNIEDNALKGHYYSGLSPLRILADRSDYTGKFSFITETNLFVGDKLFQYLKNGDIDSVGKLFQSRNAKYIVVDKQLPPVTMKPFLYGGEDLPLIKYQDDHFYGELLGKKIATFGNKYDLYEINQKYDSNLIYLTKDNAGKYQNFEKLNYKKINNHTYEINITNLNKDDNLVFLESFNKNWTLYLEDGEKIVRLTPEQLPVFDYANQWKLGTVLGDTSPDVKLFLKFEPKMKLLFNLPI